MAVPCYIQGGDMRHSYIKSTQIRGRSACLRIRTEED